VALLDVECEVILIFLLLFQLFRPQGAAGHTQAAAATRRTGQRQAAARKARSGTGTSSRYDCSEPNSQQYWATAPEHPNESW
jgi:hypothetical protein